MVSFIALYNISSYSQNTKVLIGIMLCHTTSNLPPICSNQAFFKRLIPSLVSRVRPKKARWSEWEMAVALQQQTWIPFIQWYFMPSLKENESFTDGLTTGDQKSSLELINAHSDIPLLTPIFYIEIEVMFKN